jgi:hypothetical protein
MSNVVTLHEGKRWRAVIEYATHLGTETVEHYLEEVTELHNVIEHGPDWNTLLKCTLVLNRPDDGGQQNAHQMAVKNEHW